MIGAARAPELEGLKLLVVEDEYFICEHIVSLLEDFGCDVAGPVATIAEALALVSQGGIDGALLDANLDGVSSDPIALALRARATLFVVVTGYGGLTLKSATLDSAPRLVKPFSDDELRETLIAAFGRAHRPDAGSRAAS